MSTISRLLLEARTAFWLVPALSMIAAIAAGIGLPALDEGLAEPLGDAVFTGQADAARSLLGAIAAATVSVVGIAFSVTLVALTLASQQLSPRVLRTFEARRLYQATLGLFLATFVYSLLVLRTIRTEPSFVPGLSVTLAIAAAVVAFVLFVAFIGDIIRSLQPSTVIHRIADDGRETVDLLFPSPPDAGSDRLDRGRERADAVMRGEHAAVRAAHGGFLVGVSVHRLVEAAGENDGFVRQRPQMGDFVLQGDVLADVWPPAAAEAMTGVVVGSFALAEQRTAAQDVGFPVRQLADIALRGLSPSLNDPTTSVNAIDAMGDMLVQAARRTPRERLRFDDRGDPRLLIAARDIDALVRLGFDQVRRHATGDVTVCLRMLDVLASIHAASSAAGRPSRGAADQARLVCEGAGRVLVLAHDAAVVADRFAELFGSPANGGRQPPGPVDPAAGGA